MAQREEVLARVVVLEQELVKQAESFKDLTLEAETTKLQNQHLSQEIEALKKRCSALLEDAKLAEDRVQLECEERLREFKESTELKKEIEQACKVRLQAYRDSPDLKAEIAEACQARLAEYKASDELKTAIWQKGFRMFASGFNRGLREARQAPFAPLSELRAKEEDSDGEEVLYGEDDLPLPKETSHTSAGPSDKDTGLGEKEDMEVLEPEEDNSGPQEEDVELGGEDAGPQGQEVVLYAGDGRSEQEGAKPPLSSNVNTNVEGSSVDSKIPRNVSPLRTIFPPIILDD
ncbi:uncharacterized protein LOC110604820 [Manihot esculenta]|uniref:uncharacterized protein LOC110604820 n=1 Tax=Manihot esculenta TaxID=3983 RepID=UPI000B5D40BE|nr:uncharacterized protein LOC110604820 [Manihot esculenta]